VFFYGQSFYFIFTTSRHPVDGQRRPTKTKKGPNDARRVVWAINMSFLNLHTQYNYFILPAQVFSPAGPAKTHTHSHRYPAPMPTGVGFCGYGPYGCRSPIIARGWPVLNTKLNYLERQLIGLWAVSNQIVYCLDNSLAYQKLIFITKLVRLLCYNFY
jgi:hypothetical protein